MVELFDCAFTKVWEQGPQNKGKTQQLQKALPIRPEYKSDLLSALEILSKRRLIINFFLSSVKLTGNKT